MPDCDSTGMAERSYPTSKVREGSREEIPSVQVRGGDEMSYSALEVRGGSQEEIPDALRPDARGSGKEELPHTPKHEATGGGWEEQPHDRVQGRWLGGPTPHCGYSGTGGPRRTILH